MADTQVRSAERDIAAPSIAPISFIDVLEHADELLALMASAPLEVVTELASSLTKFATDAGAAEIAEAASSLRRIASEPGPVALTAAMRDLTFAIGRARHSVPSDCRCFGVLYRVLFCQRSLRWRCRSTNQAPLLAPIGMPCRRDSRA